MLSDRKKGGGKSGEDGMDYFWYFLFYSFCGFWLEVLFARATGARKRDRKCRLFLPLCPVGAGAARPPFSGWRGGGHGG